MNIFDLFINLVITALVYLFVPGVLVVSKNVFRESTLKKIVIANGIAGYMFFSLVYALLGDGGTPSISATFIWSSIGYLILKKRGAIQDNERFKNTQDDAIESSEFFQEEKHSTPDITTSSFVYCCKVIFAAILDYILLLSIQYMVSSYCNQFTFIGGYRLSDEAISSMSYYIGFIVAFICIFIVNRAITQNSKLQAHIIFVLGVCAILHNVILFINCITTFSTFNQNYIFLPFVGIGMIFYYIQSKKNQFN